MKLGEAFVELVTDGKKLTAGLNAAENQVKKSTGNMSEAYKKIGTAMTAVGAVIIGSLGLMIKKTVDAGDAFNDMSLRTGISVENLSALAYAAKQTGTDIEAIELSLKFLTRAMDDTSKGTGTAKDTFTALGISVTEVEGKLRPTSDILEELATKMDDTALGTDTAKDAFKALGVEVFDAEGKLRPVSDILEEVSLKMNDAAMGTDTAKDAFGKLGISVTETEGKLRPTIEVMKDIADKVAAIDDPARQAAIAMELFGARSGTQLLPLLKLGAGGIDELMKKAKELGIVFTTDAARAAEEFRDRMNDLTLVLGAVGRDIANVLIPPLMELITKATEIVKKIREWAEAHKPLVDALVMLIAKVGILAAVGGPILMAVSALAKLKVAFTTLGMVGSGPIGIFIVSIGVIGIACDTLNKYLRDTIGGMNDFRKIAKEMTVEDLNEQINILTEGLDKAVKKLKEITDTKNLFGFTVPPESTNLGRELMAVIQDYIEKIDILKKRKEELLKAEKEEAEAVGAGILITEELAKATKTLADRIFELTHTALENNIRKLEEARDEYIKLGGSKKDAFKLYDLEVEALKKLDIVLNTVTTSWADFRKQDTEMGIQLVDNATRLQTLADRFKDMNTDLGNLNKTGLQIAIDNLEKMAAQFVTNGGNAEFANKWLKAMTQELIAIDAAQNNAKTSAADFWKIEREGAITAFEAIKTTGQKWKEFFENMKTNLGTTMTILQDGITSFVGSFQTGLSDAITSLLTMQETNAKIKEDMAAENTNYLSTVSDANKANAAEELTLTEAHNATMKELNKTLNDAIIDGDQGAVDAANLAIADEVAKFNTAMSDMKTTHATEMGEVATTHQGVIDGLTDDLVTPLSIWQTFWESFKTAAINAIADIIAKLILLKAFSWLFKLLGWPVSLLGSNKGGGIGYEKGGKVKGYAPGGGADTVPAMLTPGEYVISKPMVDFIKRTGSITGNLIDAIKTGARTPTGFAGGGGVNSSSYDNRKYSTIQIMPGAINIITPKFNEGDAQDMFRIIERQAKMRGLAFGRA